MVETQRLSELNDAPERAGDYVLYWMQQSQRAVFNPALETAIAAANRLGIPALVAFALADPLPRAQARHYAFMLEGLAETARQLGERGIGFVIRCGSPPQVILSLASRAALIVCDRGYLRRQQQWRREVAQGAARRVLMVEGDVVVPAALASVKTEIGARSLRPKISRLRDAFLVPLRRLRPSVKAQRLALPSDVSLDDVTGLLRTLRLDLQVGPVAGLHGGHGRAQVRLRISWHIDSGATGKRVHARASRRFLSCPPTCTSARSPRSRLRSRPAMPLPPSPSARAFWRSSSYDANWR